MPEVNKGKRLKIGSLLIILFLLLYIPSLFHWIYGKNITSDILRIGTLEESVNVDGLVVRDELLLDPPIFDGKYIPEISEGEKVPANCSIAIVLNKASDSLLKELDDMNLKIIQARNDKAKKADFFSEDIAKIDEVIGLRVQDIITECNSNSIANVSKLKIEVDKLIEKKAEVVGEDGSDSFINSLKQQKDAIQSRINANTGHIISKYSGIISYVIDGNEQALSPKAIKELTPVIIESIKTVNNNGSSNENIARANKSFAKVIRGSELYIVSVMEPVNAQRFKAGDEIGFRINDINMELNAVVVNISKKIDGKYVIAVRANRGVDELSALRKLNVDFVIDSQEGLKVPLKCLRNIDASGKKAKIMLIKANCAVLRTVDILCKDNEYAIIRTPEGEIKKTVNLYDTYILNPDNIKEGDIIDK